MAYESREHNEILSDNEADETDASSIIVAIIGAIVMEIGAGTTFCVGKAKKRIKLNHAEKLEQYKTALYETTQKLLDESLTDIERKRLEEVSTRFEEKIMKLGESRLK